MTIHMNVSCERFMKGFEESAERLPGILDNWSNLDEDLRYEYKDQISWMLDNQWQAAEAAKLEGLNWIEVEDKLFSITNKYLELADRILLETGLNIKEILKI